MARRARERTSSQESSAPSSLSVAVARSLSAAESPLLSTTSDSVQLEGWEEAGPTQLEPELEQVEQEEVELEAELESGPELVAKMQGTTAFELEGEADAGVGHETVESKVQEGVPLEHMVSRMPSSVTPMETNSGGVEVEVSLTTSDEMCSVGSEQGSELSSLEKDVEYEPAAAGPTTLSSTDAGAAAATAATAATDDDDGGDDDEDIDDATMGSSDVGEEAVPSVLATMRAEITGEISKLREENSVMRDQLAQAEDISSVVAAVGAVVGDEPSRPVPLSPLRHPTTDAANALAEVGNALAEVGIAEVGMVVAEVGMACTKNGLLPGAKGGDEVSMLRLELQRAQQEAAAAKKELAASAREVAALRKLVSSLIGGESQGDAIEYT
eukprot:SAG11_NODE_2546_length_3233_cov_2.807275_2_plen_385_part_00